MAFADTQVGVACGVWWLRRRQRGAIARRGLGVDDRRIISHWLVCVRMILRWLGFWRCWRDGSVCRLSRAISCSAMVRPARAARMLAKSARHRGVAALWSGPGRAACRRATRRTNWAAHSFAPRKNGARQKGVVSFAIAAQCGEPGWWVGLAPIPAAGAAPETRQLSLSGHRDPAAGRVPPHRIRALAFRGTTLDRSAAPRWSAPRRALLAH